MDTSNFYLGDGQMSQKYSLTGKLKSTLIGNVSESKYFFFNTNPKKEHKLAIVLGGFEKCRPDFEIKRKSFPHYVMEIPTSGYCQIKIGRRSYELKKGYLAAFSPEISHHYKCDINNPMEHIFITFVGTEAPKLLEKGGFGKGKVLKNLRPADILHLAESMLKNGLEKTTISHELCCSYLRTLLLEQGASTVIAKKTEPVATETYRYCQQYIDENFSNIFLPSEAADKCGINIRYMSRLFKQYANITPREYIMQLKLNKAANLLLASPMSIKEISDKVGFSDQYHFSRNFKKMHGLSPRKYRNTHI